MTGLITEYAGGNFGAAEDGGFEIARLACQVVPANKLSSQGCRSLLGWLRQMDYSALCASPSAGPASGRRRCAPTFLRQRCWLRSNREGSRPSVHRTNEKAPACAKVLRCLVGGDYSALCASPSAEPASGRRRGAPTFLRQRCWLRSNREGSRPSVHRTNKKAPACTGAFSFVWRRERDSNPRYAINVYTLSRRAPSATRTPLRISACGLPCYRGALMYRNAGALANPFSIVFNHS